MSSRSGRLSGRIDHIWRLAGTGFSFAAFGLGALALSIFVFPLLNLAIGDRARRMRIAQGIVHWSFRLFVGTMTTLGVIAVEVHGKAVLQADRGRLIIANHPSLIDVVLLVSLLRQTQCVVKHQNWRNPFMRGVLAATGYIRNDDDPEQLIAACADVLRAGENPRRRVPRGGARCGALAGAGARPTRKGAGYGDRLRRLAHAPSVERRTRKILEKAAERRAHARRVAGRGLSDLAPRTRAGFCRSQRGGRGRSFGARYRARWLRQCGVASPGYFRRTPRPRARRARQRSRLARQAPDRVRG
jgi:hypothetical protein